MSKPKILVARAVFPEVIARLEQHFEVESNQSDETWSKAQLMDKLRGMAALITGGDSGIGRAVAVLFAREGADVALAYLNEHEDAHERLVVRRQRARPRGQGTVVRTGGGAHEAQLGQRR